MLKTLSSPDHEVAQQLPMTILSVTTAGDDQATLRDCLADVPCRMLAAATCRDAFNFLERGGISIVVCECNLADGSWRDILDCVLSSTGRPILIVTSNSADERLWAEVLNLGGFDVVAKPFNRKELRHVLDTAWSVIARSQQPVGCEIPRDDLVEVS